MSILYNEYASVNSYKNKKPINNKFQLLNANRLTLLRAAITVGLTPNSHLKLSRELLEWKILTMLTFIDTKAPFEIKNVDDLEMSERVSVAYFIGMVFTNIHMQNKYNIRHLMHLKSPGIKPILRPGLKNSPDFWGIDYKTNQSYLVEAKGSTILSDFLDVKRIIDAEKQLDAVIQIDYLVDNKVKIYNDSKGNLEKFIIATHPNKDKKMFQHIIDPDKSEEGVIIVKGNEVIYNYYYHLVKFLKFSSSELIEFPQITNLKFRFFRLDKFNYSVGLLEDIYQVVEPFIEMNPDSENNSVKNNDLIGLNLTVNVALDKMDSISNSRETEIASFGQDGMVLFYNL